MKKEQLMKELEDCDIELFSIEDVARVVLKVWNAEIPMLVTDMIHAQCFECGHDGRCHEHHVVPRIKGGTKTVALCESCHGRLHGLNYYEHGKLVKAGLAEARRKGVVLGRAKVPETAFLAKYGHVADLLRAGVSIRKIAAETGVNHVTVQKVKKLIQP